MPKELHDRLERTAKKKGYKGERLDRYVYGTLQKIESGKGGKGGGGMRKPATKKLGY